MLQINRTRHGSRLRCGWIWCRADASRWEVAAHKIAQHAYLTAPAAQQLLKTSLLRLLDRTLRHPQDRKLCPEQLSSIPKLRWLAVHALFFFWQPHYRCLFLKVSVSCVGAVHFNLFGTEYLSPTTHYEFCNPIARE